ncbi:MAG: hypothetical protein KBG28_09940 [Kofleriaceae bacterium]|nr:hypothetical protein [Kofleriaceae bacterium]MBP6841426.1 hypothetical protein [Kofleriaceae bacterium]MBP9204273.1 hypothetical protein [Kofleriaceae bacterium]
MSVAAPGCEKDQLKGPAAEVKAHNIKLDLPAVPSFDLPKPNADGSHAVKEMRVRGKKYLNTEVTIKGYVTWAYDCMTAIRKEAMTDAEVAKLIEDDPTLCERPKFYIGDSPDTPIEKSVWVVDVPRAPNKQEIKNLPKEEIKAWPVPPPYKVGDEMIITGQWMQSSPHSERNSDGLLVYKSLTNVTQGNWVTPPPAADPAAGGLPPATKQAPKH